MNIQKSSAFFARVEGRVQGVGFRYNCMNEGRRLGLLGWVRNAPGGDVEIFAEGALEKLENFLKWLQKGPPGARVISVHYEICPPTGKYQKFGIEYY
ncbi:MAG: acylphosphatase [Treponema sp.]|nr:acylphosphatase [Treponema sp.]